MENTEENMEFNNKVTELYFKNYLLTKTQEEIKEELDYDVEMYKFFLRNTALLLKNDIGFLALGNLNKEMLEIINSNRHKYKLKDEWKVLENSIILDINKVTSKKEKLEPIFIEKETDNREVEFLSDVDFYNAIVYDFYVLTVFTKEEFVNKNIEIDPILFLSSINNFINTFPDLFKEEPSFLLQTRLLIEECKTIKDKTCKKFTKITTKKLNKFRKRENL